MNALNSLLRVVTAQQADELRLGVERAPLVLTAGVPKNLTLAETGEQVLRQMLGALLSPVVEASLARGQAFDTQHDAGAGLGVYQVRFMPRGAREPGFDVTLTNAPAKPREREAEPAPVVAPAAPIRPRAASTVRASSLEALLARASALRATDVHVRQGEPAFARIDGKLRVLEEREHQVASLLEGLPEHGADLAFDSPSAGRVRLHRFSSGGLLCLAARILPSAIPSLSELGIPNDLRDLATLPNGLVLLTGPAGSGKSTTAAALCQELLRQRSVMLLTLEDPVEYTFDTQGTSSIVRQRQIGLDTPDFVTGLREALREDPDVLLVGEMRDPESISLALTAAETGHLVFATLHSRSASSAIDRIIDAYPAGRQHQLRVQLSESLRAVIAQRLLPDARGTGQRLAIEALRRNAAVANLIREGKTPQLVSAMQSSRKDGMVLLERSLAELVRAGAVEERHAFDAANDQDSLMEYLHTRSKQVY